jgi:Fe2+ or Zn2+ uptake regulation protein
MNKIESLTPEQEANLDIHRDNWLRKIFNYELYNARDAEKTEISMKKVYKILWFWKNQE